MILIYNWKSRPRSFDIENSMSKDFIKSNFDLILFLANILYQPSTYKCLNHSKKTISNYLSSPITHFIVWFFFFFSREVNFVCSDNNRRADRCSDDKSSRMQTKVHDRCSVTHPAPTIFFFSLALQFSRCFFCTLRFTRANSIFIR